TQQKEQRMSFFQTRKNRQPIRGNQRGKRAVMPLTDKTPIRLRIDYTKTQPIEFFRNFRVGPTHLVAMLGSSEADGARDRTACNAPNPLSYRTVTIDSIHKNERRSVE